MAAVANLAFALLGDGQVERAAPRLRSLASTRPSSAASALRTVRSLRETRQKLSPALGGLQEAARVVQNGLDHHPPPALGRPFWS